MPIPTRIGRGAGLNMAFGNVLQGLTQADEINEKRERARQEFALRLAELRDKQEESKERLLQAQEARKRRSEGEGRLEELIKNRFFDPASQLQNQAGQVSSLGGATGIPSALDIEEGDPGPGPQTPGFVNDLEEQARRMVTQGQIARLFPEKFGESIFRKSDTLSPEREAQTIRIAQESRPPAKAEKPARVVTLRMPNGREQSFREDDPNLDKSISRGGVKVTSPLLKFPGKMQENFAKEFQDINKTAQSASNENAKLDALDSLLDKVDTGAFAETKQSFIRGIKGLGFSPDDFGITDTTGPADAARAIQNRLALNLRSPQGVEGGLTGHTSDADREFLVRSVPGLQATREGRKLMIDFTKRLNLRNIHIARKSRDYVKQHGELDAGWFDVRDRFVNSRSLFTPDDVRRVEQASKTTEDAEPSRQPAPRREKFDSQGNRIR